MGEERRANESPQLENTKDNFTVEVSNKPETAGSSSYTKDNFTAEVLNKPETVMSTSTSHFLSPERDISTNLQSLKPTWEVIFQSGAAKGDVIVRGSPSLTSEEVALLTKGDLVEENGEMIRPKEDSVPRLPIKTVDCIEGWITTDASMYGGPVFFER